MNNANNATTTNVQAPQSIQLQARTAQDVYNDKYVAKIMDKDPIADLDKVFALHFLPPITEMQEETKDD